MTHSFPTRRSSDLHGTHRTPRQLRRLAGRLPASLRGTRLRHDRGRVFPAAGPARAVPGAVLALGPDLQRAERSEEHTSELQSLMRISYAVFCLKKKKEQ